MSKTTLSDVEILDAIVDAQLIVEKRVAEQPIIQSVERLRYQAGAVVESLADLYQTAAAHLITDEDAHA